MSLEGSFPASNLTVDESAMLLAQARKIVMEIQNRYFVDDEMRANEELR